MGQSMKCLNGYLSLCGFKVMNQSCGYSLSVCLYVCLFGLSTSVCVLKWLGLPYEYTHSLFAVSKLGTGFLAQLFQVQSYVSACLFKCPQSYKKLSCNTFGFRFASFLKSYSCLLISLIMNMFAWMVSHEEIQGAL